MQSKIVTAASHSCIIEHSANCRIIIAVKKFSTIAACTGRCRGRGQRVWWPSTSSKSCRVEEQTKAGRQHKQWSKHTLPDTGVIDRQTSAWKLRIRTIGTTNHKPVVVHWRRVSVALEQTIMHLQWLQLIQILCQNYIIKISIPVEWF